MVWCGVVWCGVVWCGVVWCGVVWCGVVWCGVVWCGVVWCHKKYMYSGGPRCTQRTRAELCLRIQMRKPMRAGQNACHKKSTRSNDCRSPTTYRSRRLAAWSRSQQAGPAPQFPCSASRPCQTSLAASAPVVAAPPSAASVAAAQSSQPQSTHESHGHHLHNSSRALPPLPCAPSRTGVAHTARRWACCTAAPPQSCLCAMSLKTW